MKMSAILSDCRTYRYALSRSWDESLATVVFIGLNPSTADETKDDPTIRRCIGFAKSWGYGSLVMLNLFAYRATDPTKLQLVEDPVGPDNNWHIKTVSKASDLVVAAWGNHGSLLRRSTIVKRAVPKLYHLGLTKIGEPRHPLYLKKTTKPQPL